MFHKFVYTCVFIALYSSPGIQTAEGRILDLHNLTCFKYTERLKSIECELHKFAISHYGVSVRMMLNQDLDKPVHFRLWCDIIPKNSKRTIHILDVKLNACTFLKQMTGNQFLKSLLTEFKRSSNLPTSRPFKANVWYSEDNFTATDKIVPSFAPMFNFTFGVQLFEKNKMFGGWQTVGAITV